ncbi:anti-sigma factor [Streptomyces sp. NPDC005017]|uniref:anti-sigma factor n=1 Tax=Streptomyces sp. NPDC005017 TaxID=3364706 RepID=UPI0036AE6F16
MEHVDEETLALMALGEDSSPSAKDHVRHCAHCARELAALTRVVSALRTPSIHEHELTSPPVDLWDSIADELGLEQSAGGGRAEEGDHGIRAAGRERPRSAGAGTAGGRPRRGNRRLARLGVAVAACAALLGAAAGSGVTWWAMRTSTSAPSADGRQLDSLQDESAGYARLSDDPGHRTLDVTVKGLPRTSGYFEVWLMDRTHTKLVSMGVLGADGHATLPVPDNIDLDEYSVVDVSVQPYNGRPDHSGDSLVRGPYAG